MQTESLWISYDGENIENDLCSAFALCAVKMPVHITVVFFHKGVALKLL